MKVSVADNYFIHPLVIKVGVVKWEIIKILEHHDSRKVFKLFCYLHISENVWITLHLYLD